MSDRHPLGAASVRGNKVEGLAAKLRGGYPHGKFDAFPVRAQAMLAVHGETLGESHLIVPAMCDWRAKNQLNDWQCRLGRPMPIVYGWTEAYAVAGHAGAITLGGGCLRCGLDRTGVPLFSMAAWPDQKAIAFEELACGAHYQPYGPVELGFVTSLVAQLAVDCLLGRVTHPCHGIHAARCASLAEAGGRWSDRWLDQYPALTDGGVQVEREWPSGTYAACVTSKVP